MAMNHINNKKNNAGAEARFGPLTKSIDVDEALMLVQLSCQLPEILAWQEEALYRLPQPSRQRRQEIARSVQSKFLRVEGSTFVKTPLVDLLTDSILPAQLKRDLLFAQYLRATPLVWEAIREVVLPRTEAEAQHLAQGGLAEIPQSALDSFLQKRLRQYTETTFSRTRRHVTAHLIKFGLLEARPVPGNAIAKQFFAHFYQPDVRAFWFSLTQEFIDQGWTTRSERFICESSWTRIAYCTTPAYARFALDEAERSGLLATDFFGSEKQATLRGPEPFTRLVEVIRYA